MIPSLASQYWFIPAAVFVAGIHVVVSCTIALSLEAPRSEKHSIFTKSSYQEAAASARLPKKQKIKVYLRDLVNLFHNL